jgi:uncharacterized membrane protein YphA (DoxX/SURF4 family)
MSFIEKFEQWGDRHHPKWLDIIRIALGVFLIYKGVDFLRNSSDLITLLKNTSPFSGFILVMLGQVISFAHIIGGIFLIIGMFTRAACLLQIPILLCAIIFVNIKGTQDTFNPYSELFLSIIVLLLLVYFLIIGNGSLSVKMPPEEHLREHENYIHKVKGEPEE